jgi:hypothetical protein
MKKFIRTLRNRDNLWISFNVAAMFFLSVIAITGCRKDFEFDRVKGVEWNPDLALQLVNDSITLEDILTHGNAKNHLDIDESGDISILYYYNNDAFRLRPNDLIKLVPVNFSFLHSITQPEQQAIRNGDIVLPPVDLSLTISGTGPGVRVDSMTIQKGKINIKTNHTFQNDGYLTLTFPEATKNNLPFSVTIQPVKNGKTDSDIDISGVRFDLTASPNTVHVRIGGLLKQSDIPVAGDQLSASFQVTFDTLGKFGGFLGQHIFNHMQDTISVNVFNNAYTLGNLYFRDPQVLISVVNSIGIPADMTIENLSAINNVTGNSLDIANRLGAGAVFQVPSPSYPLVSPAKKTMYYTNDNTGNAMADFFNVKPDNVGFQVSMVVNPTGTPYNFFTDTSSFYADLRVKLPLFGHFDHLTYQDTFDLVIDKPEELERLEFKTHIVNGMPMTGLMQVYFVDANFNKKDSLAGSDQILIREAPVDPSTYLPYPGMFGVKDTTYILDMARMQNLENVKKMLVKAELFSPNNGETDVKLRSTQAIKVNFSARAKVRKTIQPGK